MAEPRPAPAPPPPRQEAPRLEKQVIELPDGRYLIVYGRPGA